MDYDKYVEQLLVKMRTAISASGIKVAYNEQEAKIFTDSFFRLLGYLAVNLGTGFLECEDFVLF